MGNETPEDKPKESTLFGVIRSLGSVTAEIETKIFGKNQKEETKSVVAQNSIVRARNRIMRSVEALRKVNDALEKIDRK